MQSKVCWVVQWYSLLVFLFFFSCRVYVFQSVVFNNICELSAPSIFDWLRVAQWLRLVRVDVNIVGAPSHTVD